MALSSLEDYFGEKLNNISHLWVFGYGSILWKTGFSYKSMKIGCIPGYSRRFWQGSTTHRGTTTSPGRVATLIEDVEGEVWGGAYELEGASMVQVALDHLGIRECGLGGYIAQMVPFHSRTDAPGSPSTTVLVFTATPTNDQYLGPASILDMANQVVACEGFAGSNVEYVTRLADYVRDYIPEDKDQHLLDLDFVVRALLKEKNIPLESRLSVLDNEPNQAQAKQPITRHTSLHNANVTSHRTSLELTSARNF